MIGIQGLDHRLARPFSAAGAAGDLRQKLKGSLGRAEVCQAKAHVGRHDPHEGHVRKIVAFGNHLCSNQHIDLAFLQAHPHRVALITIDIGGDNLLGCLRLDSPIDPACVVNTTQAAAIDLTTILATLRTYAPGSGLLYSSVGLLWSYDITPKWVAVGNLELRHLAHEASDSPLADRSTNHYLAAGVAYKF